MGNICGKNNGTIEKPHQKKDGNITST